MPLHIRTWEMNSWGEVGAGNMPWGSKRNCGWSIRYTVHFTRLMAVTVSVCFIPASGTTQDLIATEYMLNEWMFREPGFRPSCARSWSRDHALTTCEDCVSSYVHRRVTCVTLLLLSPATPWHRLPVITLLCPMIPGGALEPSEFSVPGFHNPSWILDGRLTRYLSQVPHYGSLVWDHFLFDTSSPLTGRKYSMTFRGEQVVCLNNEITTAYTVISPWKKFSGRTGSYR